MVWNKMIFLFQGCILTFHVNLPGCSECNVNASLIIIVTNPPITHKHGHDRWPLFWLEFRPCFGGLTFKNRGQMGSRHIISLYDIHGWTQNWSAGIFWRAVDLATDQGCQEVHALHSFHHQDGLQTWWVLPFLPFGAHRGLETTRHHWTSYSQTNFSIHSSKLTSQKWKMDPLTLQMYGSIHWKWWDICQLQQMWSFTLRVLLKKQNIGSYIWMFPKIGVPPNHPFW